ncbi:MAG: FAD-binding oxidoreductase [Candidatus Hodarchaeota archaeon]
MKHFVRILKTDNVTHDVKRFIVERPEDFTFTPGQATEVRVQKPGFEKEGRPFTFTGLQNDLVLEFIIKQYPEHEGAKVTQELHTLKTGDSLIMKDIFGTINYRGPGTFIAAGTGITPFIAIFRMLKEEGKLEENSLIFSNKTKKDVILEQELQALFQENLTLILTREKLPGYGNKRLDKDSLKEFITDFSQYFYVCGPKKFVGDIKGILQELGATPDHVVVEEA